MVYPENPEIVAEVMVNTIMERAPDACGRMKETDSLVTTRLRRK